MKTLILLFGYYANVKNDHGKKGIKANHAYLVSASVCWILKWISCWSICLRTFSTSNRAFCNSFKISTWDIFLIAIETRTGSICIKRFGRKREKQLISITTRVVHTYSQQNYSLYFVAVAAQIIWDYKFQDFVLPTVIVALPYFVLLLPPFSSFARFHCLDDFSLRENASFPSDVTVVVHLILKNWKYNLE